MSEEKTDPGSRVYPGGVPKFAMDVGKASERMEDPHLRNVSPFSSDGMLLGITRDVVLTEIATLTRLKLANVMKVTLEDVSCSISWHEGKVVPEITIDADSAEGLEPDQIRQVIQSVWWGIKPELEERLRGLRTRRAREEA